MNSTNDHDSSTNTISETEDDFVVVNSQQTAVSTLTLQRVTGSDDDEEEEQRGSTAGNIEDLIKQEIRCYRNEPKLPFGDNREIY
jgi:hypothetical protein